MPTRFLPSFVLIPFFPPIELSACDSKVVGINVNFTPLKIVLAINPPRSPIVPPPIAIIDDDLSSLFAFVDIALWDMISTGFTESISAGTPTLVFENKYLFQYISKRGRKVNHQLEQSGVQCFDIDNCIKSFDRIVNDLDNYKKETHHAIQMLKNDLAMPVSRLDWHKNFNRKIMY